MRIQLMNRSIVLLVAILLAVTATIPSEVFAGRATTWEVSYGGTTRWKKLNISYSIDYPLSRLAFGDFDGNGTTDEFIRPPGSRDWLVSYDGTREPKLINESRAWMEELAFGDFDGNGTTDVFHRPPDSRDY